jgi:hypothetical protein
VGLFCCVKKYFKNIYENTCIVKKIALYLYYQLTIKHNLTMQKQFTEELIISNSNGNFLAVVNVYQGEVLDVLEVHALDAKGNIIAQVLPSAVSCIDCQNAYDQQQHDKSDSYDANDEIDRYLYHLHTSNR